MRIFLCLSLSVILFYACKKSTDPPMTPDPPRNAIDSTLTVDSTVIHLSTSSLSTIKAFKITYIGKWSIVLKPSDTSWLTISPISGTGPTQINLNPKNLNFGNLKRSVSITISTDGTNAQTRQVEIIQDPYIFSGWSKKYGGSQEDVFKAVVATPDSGYIALGWTKSNNGDVTQAFGKEDLWIVKVDAGGQVMWQQSYGGPGQEVPWQMIATNNGYLIAATSNSTGIAKLPGLFSTWLIKIDELGNIMWQNIYDRENMGIIGLAEIPSGYVIVGQTDDIPQNEQNAVMMKVSKSGAFQWEKTFGGPKNEIFSHVASANDGGILALGNRNFSAINDNISPNTADLWLVKTDADGNFQWEKQVGGASTEYASSITTTDDGGWLVAGWGISADVQGYHDKNDVLLAKIAANGDVQWKKSYGGTEEEIAPNVVAVRGNGEYMVATYSRSSDGDITNRIGDIWMFKINAAGEIVWNKSAAEAGIGYLNMVSTGGDHRYIIAGGTLNDSWLYSFTDQ